MPYIAGDGLHLSEQVGLQVQGIEVGKSQRTRQRFFFFPSYFHRTCVLFTASLYCKRQPSLELFIVCGFWLSDRCIFKGAGHLFLSFRPKQKAAAFVLSSFRITASPEMVASLKTHCVRVS